MILSKESMYRKQENNYNSGWEKVKSEYRRKHRVQKLELSFRDDSIKLPNVTLVLTIRCEYHSI